VLVVDSDGLNVLSGDRGPASRAGLLAGKAMRLMVLAQAEAAKAVPLRGIFASSPSPALKPGLPEKIVQARTGLPASKGQPFNVISFDTPFLNGFEGKD
jgi:hypothetical protein